MAHVRNQPTKGRTQQTLKKEIVHKAVKALHKSEEASQNRHDWLARHMERQNGRCAYCGIPMFLPPRRGRAGCLATLDHVIPLARSGRDTEANTVAACEVCNSAKGHMSAPFFRSSPFCIARRKYAETVPERPNLTVVKRRIK